MQDLFHLLGQYWQEILYTLVAALLFIFAIYYWIKADKRGSQKQKLITPIILLAVIYIILFVFFPDVRNQAYYIYSISSLILIVLFTIYGIKSDQRTYDKTRIVAFIGVLSALSYLLMFIGFPIIPSAEFLKIDFSVVVILITFMWFNLKTSLLVSFITNLLDYFIKGSLTGVPIDQIANFIATTVLVVTLSILLKNNLAEENSKKYYASSVSAILSVTVIMLILNYLWIIPFYFNFLEIPLPQPYAQYILSIYGPFNLIKWAAVMIVFTMIRKRFEFIVLEEKNA